MPARCAGVASAVEPKLRELHIGGGGGGGGRSFQYHYYYYCTCLNITYITQNSTLTCIF